MFPLKNTEAYIHANGYRSTLGKELAARDAEISELGSEIQALTNKLGDETEARAALGAHNLLKLSQSTQTLNGVTFTVNSNGTIAVSTESSGASAITQLYLNPNPQFKQIGNFILNGCPSGGSLTTYDLRIGGSGVDGGADKIDTGEGVAFSKSTDSNAVVIITIRSGQVLTTPIIFNPQIRLATDADPTYQPYAKTNAELTADKADKTDLARLIKTLDFGGDARTNFKFSWSTEASNIVVLRGAKGENTNYRATFRLYTDGKLYSLWKEVSNGNVSDFDVTIDDSGYLSITIPTYSQWRLEFLPNAGIIYTSST